MSNWHIEPRLVNRYAEGRIPASAVASVEAHLLACADCRRMLQPAVDADRLAAIWDVVADRVDDPRPTPVEWLLRRLGVAGDTARLVASAPSLTVSWLTSVMVALGFALLAADSGPRGALFFLALAPILPVAGVAAAYGRHVEPTYEVGLAAPYSAFRLLLLRASAVLVATLVLAGLAALLLPVAPWVATAWLLPSLALTALTIAASTRIEASWAAVAVVVIWLVAVLSAYRSTGAPYAAFGTTAHLMYAVVLLTSLAVLAGRHHGSPLDLRRIP